ncbi:LamG-like jellyroll fold domain-containing protein [Streptomyces sp. SBT349]|uniref:LamG-like jellyroll fold domain-containing protein n=1 Tax=Streptomyces sp. SBT349 TaxID=1580539 RepID=UPI000B0FA589|nr:GH32 C-terminal domain-containing protein [Streptomyces sp. SBT349]
MTDAQRKTARSTTLGRRAFVAVTGALVGSAAIGGVARGARIGLGTQQQDGLAAHWDFGEGQGTSTTDQVSGQANPIAYVFTNAVYKPSSDPLWEPQDADAGKLSAALLFDGYSTYVTREAQLELGTEALTVEAWVAPRGFEWGDAGKESAIVNKQERTANLGFSLGVGRHGRWFFGVGAGNAWYQATVEQSAVLMPGAWAHVAGTFDPAGGAVRLYLNGEEVAAAPVPPEARFAPAGVPLLIGRHNLPEIINGVFAVNMFAGLIDEVKISGQALTASDAAAAHQADLDTFAGGTIPVPDLTMERSRYDGDRYRPGYHFTAPNHWMNEPHAPIEVGGRYHLFYQHNIHGPYWHNISWGHAVSEDLVHWRDLPIALRPTAGSVAPDGVWSGDAVLDPDGNPALLFTAGNDAQTPNQAVGLARPADPDDPDLIEWEMHPTLVTQQTRDLDVGAGRQVRFGDFRDPFDWKEGDTYFQLVGSGVRTTDGASVGGTVLMYTSQDLENWTYAGPLMTGDVAAYPRTGQVWELPVFLPIGEDSEGRQRNALLINPAFPEGPAEYASRYVYYWVGTWDAQTLTWTPDTDEPRLLDYGDHFTGPSGLVDSSERSLVFTIAQDRRTEQAHFDAGWAHNAGLPVELTMRPDGDLGVRPVVEAEQLHDGEPLVEITESLGVAQANERLSGVSGDMLHVRMTMARGTTDRFGIDVLRSPGAEEYTRLFYDNGSGEFGVDRTLTGNNSGLGGQLGVHSGPLSLDGDRLVLDVFLDRSMVEAYANGHKSITTRAYSNRDDALGLRIFGDGATVESLRVWRMGEMTS